MKEKSVKLQKSDTIMRNGKREGNEEIDIGYRTNIIGNDYGILQTRIAVC